MTRIRAFIAATGPRPTAGLLATAPAQAAPGDLDPIFSGDGKETTNFGRQAFGSGVALQPDGKIVVTDRDLAKLQGLLEKVKPREPGTGLDRSLGPDGYG